MNDELQKKMQTLIYRLTKQAAQCGYADFLKYCDISDEEYDQIKAVWKERLGVEPYV